MTTLIQNSETKNKGKLIPVSFKNTKRTEWSKYRRYAC